MMGNIIFVFLFVNTILNLMPNPAVAFIPSEKMIIERSIDQLASGPIYYEQELTFSSTEGSAQLKEIWVVENSKTMRLLVRGAKDLQGKLEFGVVYEGDSKVHLQNGERKSEKIAASFLEPWFFEKDSGAWNRFIKSQGIIPSGIDQHKVFTRSGKAYNYQPSKYVRLGRAGGLVAYVFGLPTEGELKAGLWFEQDLFNLLKIRTSNGFEVAVEKYGLYLRDQRLPKLRTYKLGDQLIQASITDVKAVKANMNSIFAGSKEMRAPEFEAHPLRPMIEEFYLRYR